MIGVSSAAIGHWEKNVYKPLIRFYPKIIEFLDYVPLPKPISFAEKLRFCRYALGMTQKQFSQLLGFNSDTIHSWETNEFEPTVFSMEQLNNVLLPILDDKKSRYYSGSLIGDTNR